jgi:hypothetical protein
VGVLVVVGRRVVEKGEVRIVPGSSVSVCGRGSGSVDVEVGDTGDETGSATNTVLSA